MGILLRKTIKPNKNIALYSTQTIDTTSTQVYTIALHYIQPKSTNFIYTNVYFQPYEYIYKIQLINALLHTIVPIYTNAACYVIITVYTLHTYRQTACVNVRDAVLRGHCRWWGQPDRFSSSQSFVATFCGIAKNACASSTYGGALMAALGRCYREVGPNALQRIAYMKSALDIRCVAIYMRRESGIQFSAYIFFGVGQRLCQPNIIITRRQRPQDVLLVSYGSFTSVQSRFTQMEWQHNISSV